MQPKKIILLASDCESTRWVYHALEEALHIKAVILEQPISKKALAKNRIKKIGLMRVIGQVLFSMLVVPFLKMRSKNRKASLISKYRLNANGFSNAQTWRVSSVNEEECLNAICLLKPDIIIVNGTRIISKKILQSTNAVFINMHV